MSAITMGTKFPAELEREIFSKVKGKSSIAAMADAEPIPFTGKDIFTFSFANDVSVVGEGGNKPAGDAAVTPVQIRPVKIVYQSRVNEEFMYAAESEQMDVLSAFADGFAKKLGEGLDIMAFTGKDPKSGNASDSIGNNHLEYIVPGSHAVKYIKGTNNPVTQLNAAIGKVGDPNGIILAPAFRTDIAKLAAATGSNAPAYPEFNFGGYPTQLGNCKLDVNSSVAAKSSGLNAVVADWDAFRWGYAKELPIEVIEYGDPDGAGTDLKRANQVLIRSEAFIGWGFLDPNAFAVVGTISGVTGVTE